MEKPFLLLLNIVASTALGMGFGNYINGAFDFSAKAEPKTVQANEEKQDAKAGIKLGAQIDVLKKNSDEAEPTTSPTPTEQPEQTQPLVQVEAAVNAQTNNGGGDNQNNNSNGNGNQTVTPSPSPTVTQAPSPSPTTQPEQKTEEKLTPNRSVQGELHAAADVTLPNVAVGVLNKVKVQL